MMAYHPEGYGINKSARNVAKNSDGVLGMLNKYYDQYWDTNKRVGVHPLYVSLQKSSPLNMLLKEPYDIKEHVYDQQSRPLDGKSFYRKYMSKSLPCVFRNEVSKNEFFLDLKAANTR